MASIVISASCENCGTSYSYSRQLYVSGVKTTKWNDGLTKKMSINEIVTPQMRKMGTQAAIGNLVPCPECGYVQSWMIAEYRRVNRFGRGMIIAGIGSAFPCILGGIGIVFSSYFDNLPSSIIRDNLIIWGLLGPFVLGIIGALASFVGKLDFLVNPNKRFKPVGKTLNPSIEFRDY
jgi:hypothetical protein